MKKFLVISLPLLTLVACGPSGPSEAEIAECMRYNQDKKNEYAEAYLTNFEQNMAINKNTIAGYTGSGVRRNENVTVSCPGASSIFCASEWDFERECKADLKYIWTPSY